MNELCEMKKKERMKRDGERWLDKDGYAHIRKDSYAMFEHKYIWEQHYGKVPENWMIHHKNGIKGDNRIENLEICSRKEHGLKHRLPNRIRIISKTGAVKVLKASIP